MLRTKLIKKVLSPVSILFLVPFIMALFFIISFGIYFIRQKNSVSENEIKFNNYILIEETKNILENNIVEILNITTNPIAIEIIENKRNKSDWNNFIRKKNSTNSFVDEWILCDTLGNTIVYNKIDSHGNPFPEEYATTNHFSEEWFRCGLSIKSNGQVYISDLTISDYNSQHEYWGMNYAAPVKLGEKIIGVVKYRINWGNLFNKILQTSIGFEGIQEHTDFFIFSKQGELVFYNFMKKNDNKLKIGKNKLLKSPNFKIKNINFNEENYLFRWNTNAYTQLIKGEFFYFLSTKRKFGVLDLYVQPYFTTYFVLPIILFICSEIVLVYFWRKEFSAGIKLLHQYIQSIINNENPPLKTKNGIEKLTEILNGLEIIAKEKELISEDILHLSNKNWKRISLHQPLENIRSYLLQFQFESEHSKFISNGINKVNSILFSGNSNPIGKLCSFLQQYTDSALIVCFLQNGEKIEAQESWGIRKEEIKIENYNLVFEVLQNQRVIQLDRLPQNFLSISGGLGQSNQPFLTLIPIEFNRTCTGVLELASFKKITPEKIEFLKQVGASIAVYWHYFNAQKEIEIENQVH